MQHKTRITFLVFSISLLSLFLLGCSSNSEKQKTDKKLTISVSSFALYDITTSIAKDTFVINHILPFGVDPHSYEPTPKTMATIEKSALVIYSGAGLEPWIRNYTFKQKVLNISKFVHLRELTKKEEHKGHHGLGVDPHYWLSIENMKIATDSITKELIALQPENEAFYRKNEKSYLKALETLQKEYAESLKSCKQERIVVTHNAYGYLAREFGFKVISLSGLSPEAQTNAKSMQRLIETIRKEKITHLFSESFASAKSMQSIADEVGLHVDTLDALGNITADEMKQNLNYKKIMERNLHKIHEALECN